MSIVFESVSYSYEDDPSQERKTGVIKNGKASESQVEAAAWGADPATVWAIRDINLTLNDGELLGIAGHTGSGKSTLIQHLNGLIHPTSGRVLIDGQDMADKKVAAFARNQVGIVFQYPESQLFASSVNDDVAFGPRNMGLDSDEVDRRVAEALKTVGLDRATVGEMSPFDLSGGQQRRAAIAGVLAMEPKVLVLDEPAAGLDPRGREEMLDLIRMLHKTGTTCVLVSHSMADLARLCDRVLLMNKGSIVLLGSPAEVFSNPAVLHEIGLDMPPAQKMAFELREAGFELNRALYDDESLAEDLAAILNS